MTSQTLASTTEAFLAYLRDVKQRPDNTVRAYRSDLRGAAAVLTMPLDAVTFRDIEGYIASTGAAASTRQRKNAALAAFFRWAMREGYVDSSPAAMVDSEVVPRGLPRPISNPAHLTQIEREIQTSPQPFRLIFTLARETGQRVGEIIKLDVRDVALTAERESLTFRAPKNKHDLVLPLTSNEMPRSLRGLRTWLRDERKNAASSAALFLSDRGTRVTYHAVRYQWGLLSARTGLLDDTGQPLYTIHQLRHTRATEWVRRYGKATAQRLIGHLDPRMIDRYAEVTQDELREAMQRR